MLARLLFTSVVSYSKSYLPMFGFSRLLLQRFCHRFKIRISNGVWRNLVPQFLYQCAV